MLSNAATPNASGGAKDDAVHLGMVLLLPEEPRESNELRNLFAGADRQHRQNPCSLHDLLFQKLGG